MTDSNTHSPPSNTLSQPAKDQGWTQIKSKSRRSKRHQASSSSPSPQLQESFTPRTENLRSVSDISSEYHTIRTQWEHSSCCASLRKIVSSTATASSSSSSSSPSTPISRAICLGIGSFDPPDGGWEAKRKAYVQLIAFLIIVEELEKLSKQKEKIPCVFQEPIFTTHDIAFLTSLGHRVVDTPQGCELVDQDSFLFGVHLYRPIYAAAVQNGPPAVFVGTGWDVWDQVSLSSEPSTDLINLQDMEQRYKKCPFPPDTTLTTTFSSTSIYFRPQGHNSPAANVIDKDSQPESKRGGESATTDDQDEEHLVNKLKATNIS